MASPPITHTHHTHATHPTELDLSPSKARAHANISQAWSQITLWLNHLFSTTTNNNATDTIPHFERNPSTLLYLQTLMRTNISATATRNLLLSAQTSQIASYVHRQEAAKGEALPEMELLRQIELLLSDDCRLALDELSRVGVNLRLVPSGSTKSAADDNRMDLNAYTATVIHKLSQLLTQIFTLQQQIQSTNSLKARFEKDLLYSQQSISSLQTALEGPDAESKMEQIRLQTAQHVRETKQIALKIGEYQERIAALSRQVEDQQRQRQGMWGVEEVRNREIQVERKREELGRFEEKLMRFGGLPPDVEASRVEVKRAQMELESWKRRREEIFERM